MWQEEQARVLPEGLTPRGDLRILRLALTTDDNC